MKKTALESLSDRELLAQIRRLRRREHLSTIEILLHLNEIERRQLYLKLGHSSLFAYCEEHLKYSASAACRRIKSARCLRRFPVALGLLEKKRVNLMTLSAIAPVLTSENHKALLSSICDKTQREAEAIASQYRPPISMRDRVKSVRVQVSEPKTAERAQPKSTGQAKHEDTRPRPDGNRTSMSDYHQTGGDIMLTRSRTDRSSTGLAVRTQQKLFIQFLASKAFMKKYEEVRALLSQRLSDTSFENVFEALVDEFLGRHCPVRRKARRDNMTETRRPASTAPRGTGKTTPARTGAPRAPGKTTPARTRTRRMKPTQEANPKSLSRHIPAAVRDKVYSRDKGRCTYVGKTGKRCGSTQALQIDHIKPFTRGGTNTISNLRLLCAKHNRLAAQELFGEEFMRRFQPRE